MKLTVLPLQCSDVAAYLAPLLEQIRAQHFISSYSASEAEVFGVMMAKYFGWSDQIFAASAYALGDANFHSEAAIVANHCR